VILTRSDRFRRSPSTLWRSVGDGVVLADPSDEGFEELVGAGSAVWALLDEPRSPREIVSILVDVYAGHPGADAIERDVSTILEALAERGLVERIADA